MNTIIESRAGYTIASTMAGPPARSLKMASSASWDNLLSGLAGYPGTLGGRAPPLIAAIPNHHFLPDEISLLDTSVLPSLRGVGARALTDLCLLL